MSFTFDITHPTGDVTCVRATGFAAGKTPDGGLILRLNTENPGGTKVTIRLTPQDGARIAQALATLYPHLVSTTEGPTT